MASKYDFLSGKDGCLTMTPYGLLWEILLEGKVKIYIFHDEVSINKIDWFTANKGLVKRLKEDSEFIDNIVIVKDSKESKKGKSKWTKD